MGFTSFTARVESAQGATKIGLSGEFDIATVPILEEHLTRLDADGIATIMLDLRPLTFIDTAGLHAFVAARDRADANGRQLILFGARATVRRVFKLIGQEPLLDDQDVVSVNNL